VTAVISGFLFFPYYQNGNIGNYEAFLLILFFCTIKFGLTHSVGISLQETVFILDLPNHLKGRIVYACYDFAKKEAVEKKNHQDNTDKTWSPNKGKEQPWTEWRRHFWLCESCTVTTIGEQTKPEYGISYFDGKKNQATSYINPGDWNSQGEVHTSMANFVQKDRKVMAHQHGKDKCQYFHHLINQLPVEKLRFGTKLLIIISSPVWLIHLLFDKRELKIIDTVKYRDWEADHFGKICFDPRMPREMEKDIAINETVTSAAGFCIVFLVLMALI
jgi:hypothetical protein